MGMIYVISSVSLHNVASYSSEGTRFENLKKINFIYGNNGTGKSTLSRFFNSVSDKIYSTCTYTGNMIENRLIYNNNFIEDNFKSDNDIPGIFTLGKEHVEMQEELKKVLESIEKNKQEKIKAKEDLETTNKEKDESMANFINLIWTKKNDKTSKISELYQHAFTGLHASKKKFYDEYLSQQSSNESDLLDDEELFKKAEVVFTNQQSELPLIPIFKNKMDFDSNIFKKSIIGQEELEFADLVGKLNLHTWVHEGYKTIQDNDINYCPFCRNELTDEIISSLSEYFNKKFENEISELKISIVKYKEYTENLIRYLKELQTLQNKYLNQDIVENTLLKVQAKNEENLKYLSEKERVPSNKVEVNLFENELEKLLEQLSLDNTKIKTHNSTVQNIVEEKEKLTRNIWRRFLNSTDEEFKKYDRETKQFSGKQKGLKKTIQDKDLHITREQQNYDEIKASMFGISSTVSAINKQLSLYGFKNFLLEAVEGEEKYKIVRENGEDANKTLSEGEKTFITFLYYYHLVKNEKSKKLIFIDDPISSLDSTVLYIVSTLIKDLLANIDKYKIEQMFISTHNTYFFKEITYKAQNCSYYVIRKNNDLGSYAKRYEKNPITNSYEALWKELVELKDSSSNVIQNVMRRILENYFKFLGGIELEDLVEHFEEDEKIIVSSLIKWTHDGSHHIQEDLYVQQQSEINEKYFEIFTKIFIESKHKGHLDMMIKKCVAVDNENPFRVVQRQTA